MLQTLASMDIAYLVRVDNNLIACYIRLLQLVKGSVLAEFRSKWSHIAMVDVSSVDPQNFKFFILPELLRKFENENAHPACLFCMKCFRHLKICIKSDFALKLNFEFAPDAQLQRNYILKVW